MKSLTKSAAMRYTAICAGMVGSLFTLTLNESVRRKEFIITEPLRRFHLRFRYRFHMRVKRRFRQHKSLIYKGIAVQTVP